MAGMTRGPEKLGGFTAPIRSRHLPPSSARITASGMIGPSSCSSRSSSPQNCRSGLAPSSVGCSINTILSLQSFPRGSRLRTVRKAGYHLCIDRPIECVFLQHMHEPQAGGDGGHAGQHIIRPGDAATDFGFALNTHATLSFF